jgi:hypothetical protein
MLARRFQRQMIHGETTPNVVPNVSQPIELIKPVLILCNSDF